ncbi:MAG: YjfB family protein [Deltaproteobacteria bacterium]
MDTLSIAGMAMNMQTARLQQAVGVAVLKKEMDTASESAQGLLEMMGSTQALERSINPHIGSQLDVKA